MLKMEISLNENRIIADKKYALSDMYRYLDELFDSYNLPKVSASDGKLVYRGTGNTKDWGAIFSCVWHLENTEWFMEYVTSWLFCNSDENEDENDFDVEDILVQGRAKLSKIV